MMFLLIFLTSFTMQAVASAPQSDSLTANTGAKSVSLKTNMLYDAALIPNIGFEIAYNHHWSVSSQWVFGTWQNKASHQSRKIYGGELEARRWIGKRFKSQPYSGQHLGIYIQGYSFDLQFGKRKGYTTNYDWMFGTGISYGYSLPVMRNLKLDFSLGVGAFGGKYRKYYSDPNLATGEECHVWQEDKRLRYFGPTKLEISLAWCIYKNQNQSKSRKSKFWKPKFRKGGEE